MRGVPGARDRARGDDRPLDPVRGVAARRYRGDRHRHHDRQRGDPVVIRRDTSPERVGLVTGVYTSALNVGSMITSLGTAPIAAAWDGRSRSPSGRSSPSSPGWRGRTRSGDARPGSGRCGASPWSRRSGRAPHRDRVDPHGSGSGDARPPLASAHHLGADTGVRWPGVLVLRPDRLDPDAAARRDRFLGEVLGRELVGVPDPGGRRRARRPGARHPLAPRAIIALVAFLWLAMPLGLLFAPQLWLLWSVLGGAAQGGGITVVFHHRRADRHERRRRPPDVRVRAGGGYLIGSAGPLDAGSLHGRRNWRLRCSSCSSRC